MMYKFSGKKYFSILNAAQLDDPVYFDYLCKLYSQYMRAIGCHFEFDRARSPSACRKPVK